MNTRGRKVRSRFDQTGVSLMEILIAVSILGISFTALFSSFSAALRTTDRIDQYSRAVEFATSKLNDLVADPTLAAGEVRVGTSPSGLYWRATTGVVDQRPGPVPDKPIQLLHIVLEVAWRTPAGAQNFVLQTLKFRVPQAGSNP
jgi:prepilin-type N-terminal cleavage/methylation domain-containing protein